MGKRPGQFYTAVADFKREFLRAKLLEHGENRNHTAKAIGISRVSLSKLIQQLGIDSPPTPGRPKGSCKKKEPTPSSTVTDA